MIFENCCFSVHQTICPHCSSISLSPGIWFCVLNETLRVTWQIFQWPVGLKARDCDKLSINHAHFNCCRCICLAKATLMASSLPQFSLRKVVSEPNFTGRLAAMVHAAFLGMSNSFSTYSNARCFCFRRRYSCVRHSCLFAEVSSWCNLISPISARVPAGCRFLSRWVGNSARCSSHRYMQVAHSQTCESCSRPQTAQHFSFVFPLQRNKEDGAEGAAGTTMKINMRETSVITMINYMCYNIRQYILIYCIFLALEVLEMPKVVRKYWNLYNTLCEACKVIAYEQVAARVPGLTTSRGSLIINST